VLGGVSSQDGWRGGGGVQGSRAPGAGWFRAAGWQQTARGGCRCHLPEACPNAQDRGSRGGGQRGCCVGGGVFLRAAYARHRSVVLPGAFCALLRPRQPSLAQSLCWDSAATPKSGSSVGLVPSLEGDGGAVQHLMIITRAVPGCPGLGTVLGGCLSCEFGGSPRYRIW
jgi:hypothetical protein